MMFMKFLLMQQLKKLSDFLRESGDCLQEVAYIANCLLHLYKNILRLL